MSNEILGTVQFAACRCTALLRSYANGRPAVVLVHSSDQSPVACATVNLPDVALAADEILVKDYSENQGILAALVAAGIVITTGRTVSCGFAQAHVCRLLTRDA